MDDTTPSSPPARRPDRLTAVLRMVLGALVGLLVLGTAWVAYAYASTPAAIRQPKPAHSHFRMQIINNGAPVNFASEVFQTPFDKDNCSATLTKEPAHFHDRVDQFVHLHWDHVSGGLVLKNYGWNFISGPDNTLGYRFDQLPRLTRVAAHGQVLPRPSADAKYYVYVGNQENYWQQSWDDFLRLDLKDFFSAKPGLSHNPVWIRKLIPSVSAHNGVNDGHTADSERLIRLNNLLGNVVIFVQKDQPTDQQIKDRFNQLIPLPESSCAG